MNHIRNTIGVSVLLLTACGGDASDEAAAATPAQERTATALASGSDRLPPEEIEAGRMVMDWRDYVERDTTSASSPRTARADSIDESWDDISMETANSGPIALPVYGDIAGPSVLRVQVLLDRALFSPGIIDGKWGRNTEKAVYWLQKREGLKASGEVDEQTWQRLRQLGGETQQIVRSHTLTQENVSGPFVELPADYYDRRDMDCQCYESLAEKLAETFHTSRELLEQLNPGTDLNSLTAGRTLNVPVVEKNAANASGNVARVVISDGGGYLHAQDASGRILYHFPATLGADYSPSPSGEFSITAIAQDPTWHYQPDLLEGVADSKPDAVLPPGPNNAVGVVWMQLSKEHYGIHGTSAPETIGYATSNGCVRLTNWDARFLSQRVSAGTPVQFRDVR